MPSSAVEPEKFLLRTGDVGIVWQGKALVILVALGRLGWKANW
jgi:hypothetical protein